METLDGGSFLFSPDPALQAGEADVELVWRCMTCGYQRQSSSRVQRCPQCGADADQLVGRTAVAWRMLLRSAAGQAVLRLDPTG
jgi:hypothetical protein